MQEMSHVQMTMEKNSLQKCLLYFESLHGRPVRRAEIDPSVHVTLLLYFLSFMFMLCAEYQAGVDTDETSL